MRGDKIKASPAHDAGAFGRCSHCGRYSDNPEVMLGRVICECGKKSGWSGSFKPPTRESEWSDDVCTWFEVGGLLRPSCMPSPRPGYGGIGQRTCPHCGKKIRWADGTNSPRPADQAQGLRELAEKIREGGSEVEGAHGRLMRRLDDLPGRPIKPYRFETTTTHHVSTDGIEERFDTVVNIVEDDPPSPFRAALVELLAADRRLAFAHLRNDDEATDRARQFQRKAMEAADRVLDQF